MYRLVIIGEYHGIVKDSYRKEVYEFDNYSDCVTVLDRVRFGYNWRITSAEIKEIKSGDSDATI